MVSRFFTFSINLFSFFLFSILLLASPLSAENSADSNPYWVMPEWAVECNDVLDITGFTEPDCGNCNGAIYVTVTGNGGASGTSAFAWSNGVTTQNLFGLCVGTYTVTVSGANGETAQATFYVPYEPIFSNIYSDNLAPCNFDSISSPNNTCEKVCPGTTVTYFIEYNQGQQTVQAQWSVSGATSYTINNNSFPSSVTVTWGNPGVGSVSVVIFGQCVAEASKCVTIVDAPEAKFTTSPGPSPTDISICKGQTVAFTNQSVAASDFEWDFGDGAPIAFATNPDHKYLTPGTYKVRLIAKSGCFCADTTYANVVVMDAVSPDLDCIGTVCEGTEVTYTTSAACGNFLWAVSPNGTIVSGGGGSDNEITVLWNSGAAGEISLNAVSCAAYSCPEPAIFRIPVIDNTATISGNTRVCTGTEETYTVEPYGGTNFVWTLSGGGSITEGQGTNRVTVKWTSAPSLGTVRYLQVSYDNCYLGCNGQAALPIKILPAFSLAGPVENCLLSDATFTAKASTGAAISANWTMYAPDGSPSWTSPAPTASALVSFGNGSGFYRIFATPNDLNQTCMDKAEWRVRTVDNPAPPTGLDGPLTICPGSIYTYEALGVSSDVKLTWAIKNGVQNTTQAGNPLNVTWGNFAPYSLTVTAVSTDGLGCLSDTIKRDILPLGGFTINGQSDFCEETVGTYLVPDFGKDFYTSWEIIPADAGAIKSGQGTSIAEIFWTSPGTHTVKAVICGQAATFAVTVFANPSPAIFQPALGVCPGTTMTVQTTTPFTSYHWEAASGNTISNVLTATVGKGTYKVEVTESHGCKGVAEFTIDEYPDPNLTLSTIDETAFCNNSNTVHLKALVENEGDFTFKWFKDGAPIAAVTASSWSTNQYGVYTVEATNSFGCTAESNPILIIEDCTGGNCGCPGGNCQKCPPGAMSITVQPTASCDSFIFHLVPNTPLYLPGGVTWFFGYSGGALLGQEQGNDNPSFVFPNAGQFIAGAQAKLTNGQTCFVYDSAIVAVKAQLDPVPVCPGEPLQFEDESTRVPSRSIASWAWNFDDPASGGNNTSVVSAPAHTFGTGGTYDVTLTLTANTGCTSSVTVPVDIPDLPNPVIAPANATCPQNATEISLNPDTEILKVEWNLGDPASGANNTPEGGTVYHNYAATGTYNATAIATNIYGCKKSVTGPITISPNPLAGGITPAAPAAICEGKTQLLTAPSANVVNYQWSTGANTPTISVGEEGLYKVTLTAANGCTYTPPAVSVDIKPAPDAIIKALLTDETGQVIGTEYPNLTTCHGEDVWLQIFDFGTYSYAWSGGNGFGDDVLFSEDRGNVLSPGTYTYQVTVTDNSSGCTDITDPFGVQVNPNPAVFSVQKNGSSCDGENTVLTYSGPALPATTLLQWSTGEAGNSISVTEAGGYYLTAVNEFGCSKNYGPSIISPGPNVAAIPSGCHVRCRPDTLCLAALSGVTSWQWYFNGSPIPGATTAQLEATLDGTYHAVLLDNMGCEKASDPLTLSLIDGFGDVLANVWVDVNENGIVDGPDTLMSGISLNLLQSSVIIDNGISSSAGWTFLQQPSANTYEVSLDPVSLPGPDWSVVIGTGTAALAGCDDVKTCDLLIKNTCKIPGTVQLAACEGKTVTYHGTTIAAGNSQIIQFGNGVGLCDSLLTVQVQSLLSTTGTLQAEICLGQNYMFNGVAIPAGGSQQFTLMNAVGCDSVLTVNVTATAPPTSTLQQQVCANDVFMYQGISLSPGQTQTFTLQTAAGCDSVVTVSVSALPVSSSSLDVAVCPGDVYTYQGVALSPGQTQAFTLQNAVGCDSVVTLSVSALPLSSKSLNVAVCPGDMYTYQGVSLSPGQAQAFTLQNALGCDSVVTVTVSSLPVSSHTMNVSVCPNDMFTYQGIALSPGQTQAFTLQNAVGCDSIVTVTVSALPISSHAMDVAICANEVYTYEGVALNPGQTQAFTLQNAVGCDSIVTVSVAALPALSSTLDAPVCPGDVFTYEGVALSMGQTQVFTLQGVLGCDSVVTVTVSALPVYDMQEEVSVCPGTTYTYNGAVLQPGETRTFHFTTQEVCDSSVTVTVLAYPDLSFNLQSSPSCPNLSSGTVAAIDLIGGAAPYEYALDGVHFQSLPEWQEVAPDDYTVTIQDANDCLFTNTVNVGASLPLTVILPDAILACDSTAVLLQPVVGGDLTGLSFTWSDGTSAPMATRNEIGEVWVEVSNQCQTERASAVVSWAEAGNWEQVYVPNVFSELQADPENTIFRPYLVAGLTVLSYKFEVFDRWGDKLFHSDNPEEAWHGPMRGNMMQSGVFVWYLEAEVSFCGRKTTLRKKGDITFVR